MTQAIPGGNKLTVDEFFEAISDGDERYELVEGVAHAMARAKEGHNIIRSNVLAFVPAGKQRGCRATSINTAVQTGPDTIRYRDVVVDCGPRNAQAMTASKPMIVVEVSVPRMRDCQAHSSRLAMVSYVCARTTANRFFVTPPRSAELSI